MRLNIDFERMKEIYGDEIEEIINENIDIMIDDSYDVCKKLSENQIKMI